MTAAVVMDPDAEDPAPEGEGVSRGVSFLAAVVSLDEAALLLEPPASAAVALGADVAADDSPAAIVYW